MAKFLIAVWPVPGHCYANLALADALRRRGHEVTFFSGSRAKAPVEAAGFPFVPFKSIDEGIIDRIFFAPQAAPSRWTHPLLVQRARYHEWLAESLPQQVADLDGALAESKPDVLVCDPAFWGAFLVIPDRHAVPVAVFAYLPFCPLPGRDLAPLGWGLPPARNALERIPVRLAQGIYTMATRGFRRAANSVRARYGLPPITVSPTAFAGRVPLYLVAGAREFDYNRQDLPPTVHYIGPWVWDRERSGDRPAWLDERRRDQPWVYVTEGTVHTQAPLLLPAAARGLGNLPMQVIVQTGPATTIGDLGLSSQPDNVVLEHWKNIHFRDLLPRTDVVVTTGGAGTVLASLEAGVPLVIVPTEYDKPEVAQRVVAAGAGVRVSPRRCTPARLRTAVEHVLGDPSFRENARRLGALLGRCGGTARGAELLESLDRSRGRPWTSRVDETRLAFAAGATGSI